MTIPIIFITNPPPLEGVGLTKFGVTGLGWTGATGLLTGGIGLTGRVGTGLPTEGIGFTGRAGMGLLDRVGMELFG